VIYFEFRFLSVKAIEYEPIFLLTQLSFELSPLGTRIAAPTRQRGYFWLVHRIFLYSSFITGEELFRTVCSSLNFSGRFLDYKRFTMTEE
jgi:hypothetical protein